MPWLTRSRKLPQNLERRGRQSCLLSQVLEHLSIICPEPIRRSRRGMNSRKLLRLPYSGRKQLRTIQRTRTPSCHHPQTFPTSFRKLCVAPSITLSSVASHFQHVSAYALLPIELTVVCAQCQRQMMARERVSVETFAKE